MRVRIENRDNLERDTATMGIVNTDSSARSKYLSMRQKILSDREELVSLRNRVDAIEQMLSKLNETNRG